MQMLATNYYGYVIFKQTFTISVIQVTRVMLSLSVSAYAKFEKININNITIKV